MEAADRLRRHRHQSGFAQNAAGLADCGFARLDHTHVGCTFSSASGRFPKSGLQLNVAGYRNTAARGETMPYRAPVDDILFSLKTAVGFDRLIESGIYAGLDTDTVRAIVDEAGKFASSVLDPLNWPGDRSGSKLVNGVVETPAGWKAAYKQFSEAGWPGLPCPEDAGGQGLPGVVAMA